MELNFWTKKENNFWKIFLTQIKSRFLTIQRKNKLAEIPIKKYHMKIGENCLEVGFQQKII